ncbi:CotH kinase family protein [Draconibacterium sp. IB214405]|uniref:CotH kinase family protein n=1 Tax=Draconibacterium sp. IB214405 TaxID=3097352 RepID=UPI002A1484B1|nr:CotH kinase family protein [Draconibacterium sp. IB214405]MDX8338984.1 CotH kinase family protein [Draconibacterium sp. IB214405]
MNLVFTRCAEVDVNGEEDEKTAEANIYKVATIDITTANNAEIESKEIYTDCSVEVRSEHEKWNYSGTGRIRGRGNSTWLWYPKKPFRIKLNEKASVLGLGENKDWVLLADYRDPTHLMNTFVFTVGQQLEMPYVNNIRYVEVTLNGDYIGLYSLTEQIEEGKSRVAINEETGLLLSLDADDGPELAPEETDNFWSSVYHMPVCVKHPDIVSDAQLQQIKTEMAQLETAIKNASYSEVEQLFDVPSFIDFMLIQELVYNVEVAAPRSMYLFKDENSKWTMGPLWDFDAGFDFDWGTMYTGHNYFRSHRELVLGTSPLHHTGGYVVPGFFTDLFKSKQFVAEYKTRWLAIEDKIMADYWPATYAYAEEFAEAATRDAARWPIGKDNETEIQRMQQWLTNRVNYLNTVINNYPEGTN